MKTRMFIIVNVMIGILVMIPIVTQAQRLDTAVAARLYSPLSELAFCLFTESYINSQT